VASDRLVVLVVDDEPILLMMAAGVVEDAGFEAVEATGADEAIRILESRLDIRIIFTDINMPGSMDGLALACAVRDRWPAIEVILTSGRRTPPSLPPGALFFPKPYDSGEVTAAMRRFAG
jgi:CheY-like chemotaxis protein